MSDSNWGERLKVGLTQEGNGSSAEQQRASGNNNPLNSDSGNVIPSVKQSPSPKIPPDQQNQSQTEQPAPHVLSDLVAQQEMADASIMMGWAAMGTLAITAIGTFFLAWQVKLTREAVKDTGNATNAMLTQNENAKSMQRAHILPTVEAILAGMSDVFPVAVKGENAGGSLALQTRFGVVVLDHIPDTPPSDLGWGVCVDIKRGETNDFCVTSPLNDDNFVIVKIEYHTVFGEFCEDWACFSFNRGALDGNLHALDIKPKAWPSKRVHPAKDDSYHHEED